MTERSITAEEAYDLLALHSSGGNSFMAMNRRQDELILVFGNGDDADTLIITSSWTSLRYSVVENGSGFDLMKEYTQQRQKG